MVYLVKNSEFYITRQGYSEIAKKYSIPLPHLLLGHQDNYGGSV